MAALSLLSLVNIFLYILFSDSSIVYVVASMDIFLSLIFFVDFIVRFKNAKSKANYFFKEFGWADLLASVPLPQFKSLRIFRLAKAYNIISKVGIKNVIRGMLKERASSALYLVLFTIILLLEFASISILYIEGSSPESNIQTASDAFWWVYVTITTVGYGDHFPVTDRGRALGMAVMFFGVGLFGVLTGFLANIFLANPEDKTTQLGT